MLGILVPMTNDSFFFLSTFCLHLYFCYKNLKFSFGNLLESERTGMFYVYIIFILMYLDIKNNIEN